MRRHNQRQKAIIIGIIVAALVIIAAATIVFIMRGNDEKEGDKKPIGTEGQENLEKEDPQNILIENMPEGEGANVEISEIVNENENDKITFGIDVAKYQGTIAWKKVAEAGIDFAMIRVGYRTLSSGEIVADSNAKYNMQEAQKYGIQVGAYFFSTAVSEEEAIEEADWVADYVSQYQITYPIAYNCEGFTDSQSRQFQMSKTERTDVAIAFLNRIAEHEYTPMFYASKGEMESDAQWETTRIEALYKVWVAQYPNEPYPQTSSTSYTGKYAMWQHTNQGVVPGISMPVDLDIAYFGYDETEEAKNNDTPEEVGADPEALMKFTEVNESVTAKDKTNLRDKPSQGSDSQVMYTLSNGETATRTGVSSSGWSRIVFQGETYYAVSSYLTTDLSYRPPQEEPDDGFNTKFTSVNEKVTAKEEVNLRNMPSVTNTASKVVATIRNGEIVTRTGVNNEMGWSRVEYNGETLYCVSSYLMSAE